MSSEENQAIRKVTKDFIKVNSLEGYFQNGNFQKINSHEVSHPQSFFCTIHGSFLKVKLDETRSKRSADKYEKLVNHQRLVFFFCDISTC